MWANGANCLFDTILVIAVIFCWCKFVLSSWLQRDKKRLFFSFFLCVRHLFFRVYGFNFHILLILAMSLVYTRCLINDTITERTNGRIRKTHYGDDREQWANVRQNKIKWNKSTIYLEVIQSVCIGRVHYKLHRTWLMIALLLMVCLYLLLDSHTSSRRRCSCGVRCCVLCASWNAKCSLTMKCN